MSTQKVVSGLNSSEELLRFILDLGIQRPFIVTGKSLFISSGAQDKLSSILERFDCQLFNDFSPNPTFDEALRGLEEYSREDCDGLIAIGGGSAIDIAKTINALNGSPNEALQLVCGQKKIKQALTPLIAIPTTAGTGSESTHFSVIYVEGKKYSLASEFLLPDVAILDASLTESLSSRISACTGFDALCQAIESYWAVGATDESRQYAGKAIPILMKNLPLVVNDPNLEARGAMLEAANLAGKAINISKTTAPHALSYQITSEYNLPHGHAVALTLGRFFTLNHSLALKSQRNDVLDVMQSIYGFMSVDSAVSAEEAWYQLMQCCGLDFSLPTIGIAENGDVEKLVNWVNIERLSNHPLPLTSDDLKSVFNV